MRNNGRRQLSVKFSVMAKVLLLHEVGSLGIVLANLCYLVSYLLLEKLSIKFVFRALESFLFFSEFLDHLHVVLTYIESLLQDLHL